MVIKQQASIVSEYIKNPSIASITQFLKIEWYMNRKTHNRKEMPEIGIVDINLDLCKYSNCS